MHAQHGVELLLGEASRRSRATARSRGCAPPAAASIECDFAVVGIGVAPRVELATRRRPRVDNGIVVDEKLADLGAETCSRPATSRTPGIRSIEQRIRVEHWANALNQGPAAARAMLGQHVSYDRIPYFFSDQYDVGMEYSGYAPQWDEVVFRGDRVRRRVHRVLAARRARASPG